MDIRAYLESGILEEYALGLTSAEVATDVERMAEAHPEVRAEIAAIRASLDGYVQGLAKAPPPALRQRVLMAVETLETEAGPAWQSAPPTAPVAFQSIPTPWWAVPPRVAAAYALLGLSLGGNAWLYTRWQRSDQQLVTQEANNRVLAQSALTSERRLTGLSNDLLAINDPDVKILLLNGLPAAPTASAVVYWNPRTAATYLAIRNLPPPSAGRQYQAWAIVAGQPVSAGLLDPGRAVQPLANVTTPQAFAITLEPRGGSPAPTGQMVVKGNA